MHKTLHLRYDEERLYAQKKEDEDLPTLKIASIQRLDYIKKRRRGKLITATRNNIDNTRINKRETMEISLEKTWT